MTSVTTCAQRLLLRLASHRGPVQWSVLPRAIHSSVPCQGRDVQTLNEEKKLLNKSWQLFEEVAQKRDANKKSFEAAVDLYIAKEEVYRRGHVEFVYSALKRMKEFKAADDLEIYKKLLDIFPTQKMIPKSPWQVEFMHFPRQQQCAIDLMDEMEYNGVIPDQEFGAKLKEIFGTDAHAFRKYRRMMYWLPKFKNANPYPVPRVLPEDPIMLAILALKRMSVDKGNVISVWKTLEAEMEPKEDTFIVSAQSPMQQDLLGRHPSDIPVFVEGGYTVWLREKFLTYFTLRADPSPSRLVKKDEKEEEEDLFHWKVYDSEEPSDLLPSWSIHEQEEGTVLATCVTGTASKDSLMTWIRYLQRSNPALEDIPVVFSLRSPDSQLKFVGEKDEETGLANT